ncbi:MAG: sugar isomerase domain-containing protein [Anaerolineae bacterium]|nr:sugar isomerase domain-containing protein [Anaerolineae bacterium]
MLIERYFAAIQAKIAEIATDQEPIRQAARLCADALARGGVLHIYDSGHIVSQELVRRAGGLVAFSPLTFSLNVNNAVLTRREPQPADARQAIAFIEHIFDRGQLHAGDVLFVGSVSGKSASVVELAIQARAHGLTVIALTSPAYSGQLVSEHPTGKRLHEVADLVLDNHAPPGDAMLAVEGLDAPLCPASGIGAACVLWGVTAGIVEEMLARGLTPSVYASVNLPDGPERVRQVEKRAMEKGY